MASLSSRLSGIIGWLRNHPRWGCLALHCIPDVPYQLDIDGIGPLQIRLRRNRTFWLRHPLSHERYPLALLEHLIRPSDVVYDVGANVGLYLRFIGSYFGAGHVVAFEPMSDNLPLLEKNVRLGGLGNRATIVRCALADVECDVELQVDDVQTASAVLDRVTGGAPSEGRASLNLEPKTETVPCYTLDHLMQKESLPVPDLIKVDIEGAEAMMLRGAREVLSTQRPRLLVELHGPDVAREVVDFLFDLDYHVAGKVNPDLFGNDHARIRPSDLDRLNDRYDLHFIGASTNPDDLPDDVAPFSVDA